MLWAFTIKDHLISENPSLADDIVSFVLSTGISDRKYILYGVNVETGQKLWEYPLQGFGAPHKVKDAIVIAHEHKIEVLDSRTGEVLWTDDIDSHYIFNFTP